MKRRIVILGAGVAGAQVLKHLQKKFQGDDLCSITVIDRQSDTVFVPMLHEVATGAVSPLHISHPIRKILGPNAHFHQGTVQAIDLQKKVVRLETDQISYDYLVVALGSRSNFFGTKGTPEHVLELKNMADVMVLRNRLIDRFEQACHLEGKERSSCLHFVIVGGGYTGVELAGQMSELFRNEFRQQFPEIKPDEPRICLVHAGDRLLPVLTAKNSERALKKLNQLGIKIRLNDAVMEVTASEAILKSGEHLSTTNVIWTAGILGVGDEFFPPETLQKNRVMVKATLQMPKYPEVMVIGDLAAVIEGNGPHPQTAQAAFEQAKLAAENIHALCHQQPLKAFYFRYKGELVPIGNYFAIGEIFGFSVPGFLGWLIRRAVYLEGLFSWRDRFHVFGDWISALWEPRDTEHL